MALGLEKKILYVGFDDSNHSGKTLGEIDVAIFSFNPDDHFVEKFPNKKDTDMLHNSLKSSLRDLRFTILFGRDYAHTSNNLPYVAPYLVRDFLKDRPDVEEIHLYFDGELKRKQKQSLKQRFFKFPPVIIKNFVKRRGRHECPKVVYLAHVQANSFYRSGFSNLMKHKKLIEVPGSCFDIHDKKY